MASIRLVLLLAVVTGGVVQATSSASTDTSTSVPTDTPTTATTPSALTDTSTGATTASVSTDTSTGATTASVSTDTSTGAPTASASTDTSTGAPTASGSTDTSTAAPTASVSTDTSTGAATATVSTDSSTAATAATVSTDTSTAAPTATVSTDTSTAAPTASVSTDTSTAAPTASASTDTSTAAPSVSVSTDTSTAATSVSVSTDTSTAATSVSASTDTSTAATAATVSTDTSTAATAASVSTDTSTAATTVSSSTYTSTSATTAAAPKFPTSSPNIGNAVFTLSFTMKSNVNATVNDSISSLKYQITENFKNLRGFRNVTVSLPGASRTKQEANDAYTVGVNFAADSLTNLNDEEKKNFTNELKDVILLLNNTNFTVGESPKLEAFVQSLSDVCNANGSKLCEDSQTCRNGLCYHKCEFYSCGDHGLCILSTDYRTKCECSSDDVYYYRGDRCDESYLKERWIGAIAGAIGAVLLLVLVVLVICLCLGRRKGLNTSYDSPNELGDVISGSLMPVRYNTSYDNTAFQGDRGVYSAKSSFDPNGEYSEIPHEQGDPQTGASVPTSAFVIKRPTISLQRFDDK